MEKGKKSSNELLPSEQDRKAVVGCLAAVLNVSHAARRRDAVVVGASPPARDSAAPGESSTGASCDGGALEDGKAGGDLPAVNFSIRQDDDDNAEPTKSIMGRSSKASQQQQHRMRRTRSFQRQLLGVSAELLLLTPDHAKVFLPNLDIECADREAEHELLLKPFLESLSSSEEAFRCIALLMFRFLLLSGEEKPQKGAKQSDDSDRSALESMTIVGYDSRVRFAYKYLAVSMLSYWELKEHGSFTTPESASAWATRKFEALEDGIAARLSILSKIMMQQKDKGKLAGRKKQSTLAQSAIRGLKIGAAGVAAGTVFAITGGLAAPAIVGGIAALTGIGSAASVVATILLLPAATTIFGVGGGTLVASKMTKRTAGLEEFDIEKVTPDEEDGRVDTGRAGKDFSNNPELSRTVCVGGWLLDEHDFERPFGTTPRGLADRHELFCRFCSVYAPHIIRRCKGILEEWKGREDELWDLCKSTYGRDPRSLLPLEGPRYEALLTEKEGEGVDELIRAMGLPYPESQNADRPPRKTEEEMELPPTVDLLSEVLSPNSDGDEKSKKQQLTKIDDVTLRSYQAWDFHAQYGSELYVIKWERALLLELAGSAKKFQRDLAKKAAGEALKKTAMASLLAAVAIPAALLSLSNIIDEQWTLVAERSDEAGVLLAQSLLNSDAGHRPVSLVGFSFGARMIVSCLKELARNQAIWERQQEEKEGTDGSKESDRSKMASIRKSLGGMSTKQRDSEVEFSREPASIVEDVVLMGCPASVNKSTWLSCRGVVGGRLVNCYSQNDVMLALMYRAKNLTTTILSPLVGIGSVDAPGIENRDVSGLVGSHGEYCVAVREILEVVGYGQPANLRAYSDVDT